MRGFTYPSPGVEDDEVESVDLLGQCLKLMVRASYLHLDPQLLQARLQ
jgi:hypothetical protein